MAKTDDKIVAYTLFLLGLVFLIESVVFTVVLGQVPSLLLGSIAPIAWVYAIIKFFAGLVAIYAGISAFQKK